MLRNLRQKNFLKFRLNSVLYCWCYQRYKFWLSNISPRPTLSGATYRTIEVLCTCHQGSAFAAWPALNSCGKNRRITAPHSEQREGNLRNTAPRTGEQFLFWLRTTVNLMSSSVRRHNGQVMSVCTISNTQDVSRLCNSLSITIPCLEVSWALRTSRTDIEANYLSLFYLLGHITHLNKRTLSY